MASENSILDECHYQPRHEDPYRRPACQFHADQAAEFVGAQSVDQGETLTWVPICTDCAKGWNDGGDWLAPVYCLGPQMVDPKFQVFMCKSCEEEHLQGGLDCDAMVCVKCGACDWSPRSHPLLDAVGMAHTMRGLLQQLATPDMEICEDRCRVCRTLIGMGVRSLHVGVCDRCREKQAEDGPVVN